VTRAERFLVHQIHPLKLLTDVSTSFASSWLLWEARWAEAAAVALAPSVLVSALLLWGADLERYARTPAGRYVVATMTRGGEAIRLVGQAAMWIGAATHLPWLLPLGALIVVYGWAQRLWAPDLPAS
jgi:hypothetical protein